IRDRNVTGVQTCALPIWGDVRLKCMSSDQPRVRMDDVTIERVLRVVEAIPPGRVAAYGEVGAIVGVGPRLVGGCLGDGGGGVPGGGVANGSGALPVSAGGLPQREAEGIAIKPNGRGCRIREFGADLDLLRQAAARPLAQLEEC